MPTLENHAFNSYIKDIQLELPDYKFTDGPIEDIKDPKFVGRAEITKKFLGYLEKGGETGAYLVTGYRGMGKTSFVKRAINEYKENITGVKRNYVKRIDINIGQKNIKELDILRQIIKNIQYNLLSKGETIFTKYILSPKVIPVVTSLIALTIILNGNNVRRKKELEYVLNTPIENILTVFLVSLAISITVLMSVKLIVKYFGVKIKFYNRLAQLYERCVSEVAIEGDSQTSLEKINLGFGNKKTRSFPIANPKEVENEIIDILDKISKIKKQKKRRSFIFVFDEIDKIEPPINKQNLYEDQISFEARGADSEVNFYRERRDLVLTMLSNLKYLITTAKARFVFIAGREMFDAALADVADRQSSISSIFHQVIYVDSFLKDKLSQLVSEKSIGFTDIIEEYLEFLLIPQYFRNKLNDEHEFQGGLFLRRYYMYLLHELKINETDQDQDKLIPIYKIIVTLQNLIVYLTYRSNGSPKKLTRLMEDLMISRREYNNIQSTIDDNQKIIIRVNADEVHLPKNKTFLNINYTNQYRFGFISYLYRPFIISNSKYIKLYSDRLLVSITYLMDHIIKFHPFAFSLQNLEVVPEVLSETRSPELREFIENLVTYLSQNHLRDTEIGLFEFKFYNKTYHELAYLSKIFEDESAAFNFTLDETFNIKLLIRNKIKELRSIYKDFKTENPSQDIYVNSISFLNEILGDISYFDQEYDDAIVAYSDAIQALGKQLIGSTSLTYFIIYHRYKLKLGLTFEKMKAYDVALGHYTELINFNKQYFEYNDINLTDSFNYPPDQKRIQTYIYGKPELIQIVVQPFIANLYIREKLSPDGINHLVIREIESSFDTLFLSSNENGYTNNLIKANFYSNIATLLFYKNYPSKIDFEDTFPIDPCLINIFKRPHNDDVFKDFRVSWPAMHYYIKSIEQLCISLKNEDKIKPDILSTLLNLTKFVSKNYETLNKTILKNIATGMSNIADTLLSCLTTKINLKPQNYDSENSDLKIGLIDIKENDLLLNNSLNNLWNFDDFVEKLGTQNTTPVETPQILNSKQLVQFIMALYYWSGWTYMRAGRSVSYSFQLRKIFHVARVVLSGDTVVIFKSVFKDVFLKEMLQVVSWNSLSTDRPQLEKYKYYLDLTQNYFQPRSSSKFLFTSTSTSPEVKEIILFYTMLEHKMLINSLTKLNCKKSTHELLDMMKYQSLVNPYNIISSQFVRVHELHLQVEINKCLLQNSNNLFFKYVADKWISPNQSFDEFKLRGTEIKIDPPSPNVYMWDCDEIFKKIQKVLKRNNIDTLPLEEILSKVDSEFNWAIDLTLSKIIHAYEPLLNNTNFDEDKITHFFARLINKSNQQSKEFVDLINLVSNSIFSLTQIITIYNSNGISYLMNYSALGDYHRRLGYWLKVYEFCKYIYNECYTLLENGFIVSKILKKSFVKQKLYDCNVLVEKLIKKDGIITLKPISQYHMALRYYYLALHLHQERMIYKQRIINMYYLEDDYNDNLYHFGIALERQKMNSGNLRKKITDLKEFDLKVSTLSEYEYYI